MYVHLEESGDHTVMIRDLLRNSPKAKILLRKSKLIVLERYANVSDSTGIGVYIKVVISVLEERL
jgi:hypothetical protein